MLDEWIRKIDDSGEKKGLAGWNKWGRYILAALICLGLMAVIWPGTKSDSVKNIASDNKSVAETNTVKSNLTGELESILSQVDGAGKVQVSLTLSSGGVKSYASNTKNEAKQTQETDKNSGERSIKEESISSDVAVSGGAPMLVEDKAPRVLGVLVVADGARDSEVKENLTDATATLLNISPHQVRVVARGVGIK